MDAPTVGSLFAGVGGFDLGFERAGFAVKWQVEINERNRRVLAKHWPHVRQHDDVRTFPVADGTDWRVDVIVGGFPCQDVSRAGLREGIEGERSGLYAHMLRVVRSLRPRYVVVENVTGLLDGGLGAVLGDLAASGFDAEWSVLSACAVGAAHTRERVFLVAYPHGQHGQKGMGVQSHRPCAHEPRDGRPLPFGGLDADAGTRGATDGIPGGVDRVERIAALGNAVVPQVAEFVARCVMRAGWPNREQS